MMKKFAFAASFVLALTACHTTQPQQTSNITQNQVIKQLSIQTSQSMHALPRTQMPNFANIAYDNKDARQKLDIYLPRNSTGKAPTVIYIHGGGWISGDKIEVASSLMGVDKMMKHLLDNGYAVVSVDYRFAPDYLMPAQTDDVTKAFEFIVQNSKKYGIDDTRLAVMGESAGGHLIQWLSVTQGKRIKASIPFYAPSDLSNMRALIESSPVCKDFNLGKAFSAMGINMSDDFAFEEVALAEKVGTEKFIEKAKSVSPIVKISQDTSPTLMFHGDADCVVAHQSSVDYLKKLQQYQIPSELITLKGEGHATAKFWTTPEYQNKVLAFLKKYL